MEKKKGFYTLLNGAKVDNLRFAPTGVESWEQSQWYWDNGKRVSMHYNTETGEIKIIDARGKEV